MKLNLHLGHCRWLNYAKGISRILFASLSTTKMPEKAKFFYFFLIQCFRWIESQFDEADLEKEGYISEKTAIRLIRQMNKRLLLTRVTHKVKVCHKIF